MKTKNQKGTKVDFLTVIDIVFEKGRHFCVCACDCGNIVKRRTDYINRVIKNHKIETLSCGCKKYEKVKAKQHSQWSGYEDLSGEYISGIRCRAKGKKITKNRPIGIEFNISAKYLWDLFITQNKKCALTGLSLTMVASYAGENRKLQTASLDRIDNNKGYIEGNVRWLHKDINKMRGPHSDQKFIEYCKMVGSYNT